MTKNQAIDLAVGLLIDLLVLHQKAAVEPSATETDQLRAQEDVVATQNAIAIIQGLKEHDATSQASIPPECGD